MTWTGSDPPVPAVRAHRRRWDHLPHATSVQRFNRAVAIKVTGAVGSMTCAYLFCVIALIGLPAAWQQTFTGGIHPLPLVQWTAQTLLQLVLLSIILVGQNVAGEASDARATETLDDTRVIIDRLDTRTQHGLGEVMVELGHLRDDLGQFVRTVNKGLGGGT